jgi:hypothetical protein
MSPPRAIQTGEKNIRQETAGFWRLGLYQPKLPKEIKVFFSELMAGFAALKHLAWRLSRHGGAVVHCYLLTDDFSDFFYQAWLSASSEWLAGMVTLSLRRMAGALGPRGTRVRYLVDHVLGQGTTNGSNVGQRIMYLVLHIFTLRLEETEGPALLRV